MAKPSLRDMTSPKIMTNTFYNTFDTHCLDTSRKDDYRTPFEQDRDRIIHTSAFRRLQAKTQVFLSGEYDFYRTRLTHSLEVAQIGRAICTYLHRNSKHFSETYCIDSNLVEAICLSHDLGHPPFGHAGERTLNALMRNFGGFEGNAQTLRLLTETVYSEKGGRKGMSPTRAFVDGVLKYKTLFSELKDPTNHFVYDEQKKFLEFVFDGVAIMQEFSAGKLRDHFRSIECQIMDWSDDVAYSLNDVVDGIHSGFITKEKIERWAGTQQLSGELQKPLDGLFDAMKEGYAERYMSAKIGKYISACSVGEVKNIMSEKTNRYKYELKIDDAAKKESKMFKTLSLDLVFRSPQLNQVEKKGDFMLRRIFDAFTENYINKEQFEIHLLPASFEQNILSSNDNAYRARLICDYIAGMTDGFAIRTYKRLFDPDFGSLADLV
ncbi:MAG: dNTP triphosphohydrolase [Bacteroidota bacterium]|nr:dNTP triphosphohydrolase [Bacteroidota bacterium]